MCSRPSRRVQSETCPSGDVQSPLLAGAPRNLPLWTCEIAPPDVCTPRPAPLAYLRSGEKSGRVADGARSSSNSKTLRSTISSPEIRTSGNWIW